MTSYRTMAALLDEAREEMTNRSYAVVRSPECTFAILAWQRAKACRDQRDAMQIEDDKTLDELEALELRPFRALAAQAPSVMSAHIVYPRIDPELPATLSPALLNGLLRQRVKTGLTGARYAEYRYNQKQQLVEIIYHETVRGEKTFVKKHLFDYSLAAESGAPTALRTGN